MSKHDLSMIMRRAWQIVRATGEVFAVCLSRAWALYRLVKRMRADVVRFCYKKTDGTLRRAVGTLRGAADIIKGTGCVDDGRTVKYYDVEAGGFRSFRVDNFITSIN